MLAMMKQIKIDNIEMKATSQSQIQIIERFDEIITEKASKHSVREMEAEILNNCSNSL
jgi:hypothetical protein